jgi:hypothetical protein
LDFHGQNIRKNRKNTNKLHTHKTISPFTPYDIETILIEGFIAMTFCDRPETIDAADIPILDKYPEFCAEKFFLIFFEELENKSFTNSLSVTMLYEDIEETRRD